MLRLAFATLLAAAPALAAPIPDGAFVRTDGARFVVDGKPFAFVGANLAIMQGTRERAAYRETLHAAAGDGLTVARVWALGEGPVDASDWYRRDHLFRAGPDGFIEESYRHLDRVLAAARAEGVRLVLTLVNHWDDYGGVAQYLRWAGLPSDGEVARDRFYRDDRTRAFYRAHLEKLLQRTNTVTGVRYVDDPTIFAWELVNESEVATDEGAVWRRDWIVEMARFIKARDPHHLVTPGLIGYVTSPERREWIRVASLPEVDYCDSHLYPQMSSYVRSWPRLAELIDDRAQLARFVVGKPLVIGEFGFLTADHDSGRPERAWLGRARASWFRRFLDRVFADGAAGAMAWIYTPWLGRARDYGIYVDRGDTRDVRGVLRRVARAIDRAAPVASNPLLGPKTGDRPLYDTMLTLRGSPSPAASWRRRDGGELLLEIAPRDFALARFENAGSWDRGVLEHVYGVGAGRFEYRFTAPPATARGSLAIEARVSSEWPGTDGPAEGRSPLRVSIDGVEVARFDAGRDDGLGEMHTIAITDRALLARLARGVHTLVFEVPDEPAAHGLCLYGAPTGRGRPPVGESAPLRLRWTPTESALGVSSR